jgi:hypothetical protein
MDKGGVNMGCGVAQWWGDSSLSNVSRFDRRHTGRHKERQLAHGGGRGEEPAKSCLVLFKSFNTL